MLMIRGIYNTIRHFLPDFFERLHDLPDLRKKCDYEISEIIFSAIAMHIFKEGSRNAFNNDRSEENFKSNYQKIFKKKLPHMDTVNDVLKVIPEEALEILNASFVRQLIEKKVFKKFNLLGQYYCVAIDGTGVMQVKEGHCDHCLFKISKKGKISYFHNVLEAKLICSNGFSISIGTEWIENLDEYEKQDCEQKAFKRLASKIKKLFPRLPICLVADGLYPNKTFFGICQDYNWRFIVTFKDGNLPSVWEEVEMEMLINRTYRRVYDKNESQTFVWLVNLEYQKFKLHWVQCHAEEKGKTTRFVFLTDIKPEFQTVKEIVDSGRMRSNIEDSFNTQKNRGYAMSHKYSRVSYPALKNHYTCMQIGYLINHLFERGSLMKPLLTGKTTIKHLWKLLIGGLTFLAVDFENIFTSPQFQVRFE